MPGKRRWSKLLKNVLRCHPRKRVDTQTRHKSDSKLQQGGLETVSHHDIAETMARIKRNERIPIACFPPEVLAEVFMHLIPVAYDELNSDLSWIKVTHVSHHWREVAISCPELWTSVIFSRPNWIPVMLSRAKTVPLIIRVDLRRLDINLVQDFLGCHTSQYRELDIRAPQSMLEELFEGRLVWSPLLESLMIKNSDRGNMGQGGFWVPEKVLTGETHPSPPLLLPKLRRLELWTCAFAWDSSRYTCLTHLKLLHINRAQRPSMAGLLSVLVTMDGLQHLTLIDAIPPAADCFIVNLQHLASITLDDPAVDCASILEHLSFPSTAAMAISCPVLGISQCVLNGIIDTHLFPAIASHCKAKPVYTFAQIHRMESEMTLKLHDPHAELLKLRLHGTCLPGLSAMISGLIMTFFKRFPLTNVTELELQDMVFKPDPHSKDVSTSWKHLWGELGCFKRVRLLRLCHIVPSMILEVLLERAMRCIGISMQPSVHHIGPDGIGRQLLPRLERIDLYDIDCGDLRVSEPTLSDVLFSLLWARRQGGAGITKLHIEKCRNLYTLDLNRFKFLSDVIWDEKGENKADKEDGGDHPRSFAISVFSQITSLLD